MIHQKQRHLAKLPRLRRLVCMRQEPDATASKMKAVLSVHRTSSLSRRSLNGAAWAADEA